MTTSPSKVDATTSDPVYQKNPHPSQAYRITMTIEDAPGSFGAVAGTAFYDMTNRDDCAPFDAALGMSTKRKEDAIPIDFQKINDTTYVATIHTDGMAEVDYYDKGVCHWEFGGVGVSLKATGKHEETEFLPSLDGKQLATLTPETKYFWKSRYPKSEMAAFPDMGQPKAENFNEDARKNLFKVTLAAEKIAP
ncbi:hypothetical protein [Xanthomonas nasturtii]|uniref:hypothetical protein n=1 Tax=Xanthomonas nasturtii TaxID=1843581 RepID=UPI0020111F58|nr:hypothetical protein [Xanthomonas nasturtii]MCL1528758.1 hypothetical protein [Xanthomonas nasturtii]MCL1536483.1 hypothetical protein [Xanthomonas nasturtii]MCL1545720.1 hypothetical protein [Xanthomonas nasturtii]